MNDPLARIVQRMVLPTAEAASVIDLEPLATTRWENAAAIRDYARKLQGGGTPPRVAPPSAFTAALWPYQQQGLDWLQDLRASGMAGILADDMGLGKTAQTLAHIAVEHDAGRLDRPALIVVPTSLVANWMTEATKFTPNLRLVVRPRLSGRCRFSQGTFVRPLGNGRDAP